MSDDVKQEEEYNDESIKVGACPAIDCKGAKRCAITGILVGNARSLYCGTSRPLVLGHQGTLIAKFMGKCVPTEQDEPFEEQEGTGKMKQNRPFFRKAK